MCWTQSARGRRVGCTVTRPLCLRGSLCFCSLGDLCVSVPFADCIDYKADDKSMYKRSKGLLRLEHELEDVCLRSSAASTSRFMMKHPPLLSSEGKPSVKKRHVCCSGYMEAI